MRVTKLEVMQHLKRLHAAHGIPEHHRGQGIELAATEFHNVLRWEDSQAVEKAVDELCASDTRFFPKPGALAAVARKHRPVSTGPGKPEIEGWPCPTCGESYRYWRVQREDGSEYVRALIRHGDLNPCARYNAGRAFVREEADPPGEWDWRDMLWNAKQVGGAPKPIGDVLTPESAA